MQQGWNQVLIATSTDGTALTNTTTATDLLPAASVLTYPANALYVGKQLRVRATGRISTVVTSPGTLTLDLRMGTTVIWTGGAMSLNIVAKTNVSWLLDLILTCRAVGATTTTTFLGVGAWESEAVIGSPLPTVGGSGGLLLPASAPAVGTGIDATASQAIHMFGTWSTASASNSIQCHQFSVEDMN